MSTPEEILSSTVPPVPRGSRLLGFGLAWLVMIASYVIEIFTVDLLPQPPVFVPLFSAPWVLAILLAIAFMATGRTRTAVGIAIGLATVLVVCVVLFMLLVSALSHNFT
jgi:hypothetical protein